MADHSSGVSDRMFKKPTQKLVDSKVLEPNAHDNKDSLTPDNPYKQALAGSGKPSGPFGPQGREF